MYYVYKHIRLDTNEVFYIGIGKNPRRAKSKHNRNKWWKNIVSKTNYAIIIIQQNLTKDEACSKEIELIKQYGRRDLGKGSLVNLTNGGEGTTEKIISKENIEKFRKRMKNNKNWLGKRHTEATKKLLSMKKNRNEI